MSDWPPILPMPNWTPVISSRDAFYGPVFGQAGAFASGTWPSANLAIYLPVLIPTLTTVAQLWCFNGAAVSGNIDLGLYDISGVRLVSSGPTAQSGTSTFQVINTTDVQVYPGIYYLAMAMDNTTGTNFRSAPSTAALCAIVGVAQEASAFPLPATATFASAANAYIPKMGLTDRATF